MKQYRGVGRFFLRTRLPVDGAQTRLVGGVALFPEDMGGVEGLPDDELIEAEITVRVIARYRYTGEDENPVATRGDLETILRSDLFKHPERLEDYGRVEEGGEE